MKTKSGLEQHVSDATRTTSKTSSLLNLVINGAYSSRVFKVAVLPTHGVSNHDLVTWLVATDRERHRLF